MLADIGIRPFGHLKPIFEFHLLVIMFIGQVVLSIEFSIHKVLLISDGVDWASPVNLHFHVK